MAAATLSIMLEYMEERLQPIITAVKGTMQSSHTEFGKLPRRTETCRIYQECPGRGA